MKVLRIEYHYKGNENEYYMMCKDIEDVEYLLEGEEEPIIDKLQVRELKPCPLN